MFARRSTIKTLPPPTVLRKIPPKCIADSVSLAGSRLAQFYGLPKTHKEKLSMRPILSATGSYNCAVAKWLDEQAAVGQSFHRIRHFLFC